MSAGTKEYSREGEEKYSVICVGICFIYCLHFNLLFNMKGDNNVTQPFLPFLPLLLIHFLLWPFGTPFLLLFFSFNLLYKRHLFFTDYLPGLSSLEGRMSSLSDCPCFTTIRWPFKDDLSVFGVSLLILRKGFSKATSFCLGLLALDGGTGILLELSPACLVGREKMGATH